MQGMKYTDVEPDDVHELLFSDRWVVEQKMDGTRVIALIEKDAPIRWFQSGGQPLGHTAALQWLPQIEAALAPLRGQERVILDGELITGTGEYHLFDLPCFDGLIQATDPLWRRREGLEILAEHLTGPVHLVQQARDLEAKSALLTAVREAGAEGIVFKHRDAAYEPGQRVKTVLKLKFVKTADVVVMAVNRPDARHGSITFGVYAPDEDGTPQLRQVGNCSAIGKPEVGTGQVIEVAFLYWTGTTTYQPRMLRIREDKAAEECEIGQFPAYSRLAV